MVMLLKVNPKTWIRKNVEMTEMGSARALINVVLTFRRKRKTARTANRPPMIR